MATYNTKKKKTWTTTVRVIIQAIADGRPGNSFALNPRVVRNLLSLKGAELISDEHLFTNLQTFNKPKLQEEWGRDTSVSTYRKDNARPS